MAMHLPGQHLAPLIKTLIDSKQCRTLDYNQQTILGGP